ncbi:MAG: chemotaxis protein CheX [Dehalococcoidia bacterium]|nr:chemotaxis protein CheX [Dehalococcoidia bacterium]
MQAALVNPFLAAAIEVIEQETGLQVTRGDLRMQKSTHLGHDLTVILAVTGAAEGVVLYGMSVETALGIVGNIMGEEFPEFDELAESGIAELGNVITGRATALLEEAGLNSDISPPTIVHGAGTRLSTLDLARLVIPLTTEVGPIEIDVALRERKDKRGPVDTDVRTAKPQV